MIECADREVFFGKMPKHQNAVDLFGGAWASRFPREQGIETGGFADVFEDLRIAWLAEKFGGVENFSVLELGPLEAGHTFALEELRVREILAIEADPKAYLKCLISKEIMDLRRSHFLLGDFTEYLKLRERKFDLCVASGVLYHLTDPIAVLSDIAENCERLFLWTHYYDEEAISGSESLQKRFAGTRRKSFRNEEYEYFIHQYLEGEGRRKFCGGMQSGSIWMKLDDLMQALISLGFCVLDTKIEDHINGPAAWIAAVRKDVKQPKYG